ncbi:hypothetical protein EBB59_08180 [Lysobacter pythonis]|uniref:Uncharacterized protein n=1 Tax=Solilutibacter pythonis TaxID=2483112 RepID=A0A3M2HTV5_9GAMM|nr:hypothetical protein [Lysobacter pythonis]RMH91110.1 hypothetical protein EBB59_08180 [Lysobacter pythonis]
MNKRAAARWSAIASLAVAGCASPERSAPPEPPAYSPPQAGASPSAPALSSPLPGTSTATDASAHPMPISKPPPRTPAPDDPAIPPGENIPGSTISIPREIPPGQTLRGRVPVGSLVEIDGGPVPVDGGGHFGYPVAKSATGQLTVRIKRPAPDQRPAMTLKVDIRR